MHQHTERIGNYLVDAAEIAPNKVIRATENTYIKRNPTNLVQISFTYTICQAFRRSQVSNLAHKSRITHR